MSGPKERPITALHADTILNSVTEGVFTVNRDMVITYFNTAIEQMTGIPREEAVGQYCYDVLRANICETACGLLETIRSGQPITNQQANILRADGKMLPVSISTGVLQRTDGEIIGGLETVRDLSAIEELKREIKKSYTFLDIVSKNRKILQIFDILPNIAESGSTVLIEGPSGSGKEIFANAVHNLSARKNNPFIALNCGGLPETLVESELFGYLQGAFTDAKKDKPGRFARAEGGTLFLDEVDSLPLPTQVKLLRVLQEQEYEPLGATEPVKTNVRIIAASKEDLRAMVQRGEFRDDLYYRINVVKISLPPLSERRDDIPLLIDHFVDRFNRKMNRNITGVSEGVLSALMRYDYPGNIRELENVIEHAFVMMKEGEIQLQHLPPELLRFPEEDRVDSSPGKPLQSGEKEVILNTLENNDWDRQATAEELGIHRTTLWRKIQKYNIE